ncbi:MAG: autotransporter-associated beta strand repeat-containing protein [Verrucomicrobiales bacterium]|nr:autotransporter-associated beta strand repeat-containing protein [Verrucomicrobiales bacterium]
MNSSRMSAAAGGGFTLRMAVIVATAWLVGSNDARADSGQWTGATNANWATLTNWSSNPNPVPGTGNTATFGSTNNGNTTISLGAGVTIGTLNFTSTPSYTIGAGAVGSETLRFDHGGNMGLGGTNDQWINAAVVLGPNANTASYLFGSFSSGSTLTFAGPITGGTGGVAGTKTLTLMTSTGATTVFNGAVGGGGGSIAVTKSNGTGTLALNGTNTFTGALTIDEGKLVVPTVNNASTAGPLGNSATPVALGGSFDATLQYTGATASSTKRFTVQRIATFQIDSAATDLTLSGIIDGTGGILRKTGSGTLTLTGNNTYSGQTIVSAGTLKLSGAGDLGATTAFLEVNATLDLGGTSQTVGGLFGFGSGLIVNNSGGGTSLLTSSPTSFGNDFFGVIADNNNATAGTVAFTKGGVGSAALTGANTYSGATTVSDGVLTISGNGTLGNTVGGTTVASGATLRLAVYSSAEAITISGVGFNTEGGALEGYDTTLSGLLTLGASATVYVVAGGPFAITNPGTITAPGATKTLTLDGFGEGSIASIIGTGTGGVTVTGGKWTLTGANTFSGALNVSGNSRLVVPTVNNASTAGPLGKSATAVTLNNSALEYTGGTASSTKPFALSATGVFQINSAATDLTLSGVISGTGGGIRKTGPGTLTLTAVNTYTAGTEIQEGLLKLSGSGRLGTTAGFLLVSAGATLDLGGTSQTVTGLGGGGTILNNGGGASVLTSIRNASFDGFSGVIADGAGTVAFTKSGTGYFTISGPNTYSGLTTITDGTLVIEHAMALGSSANGTSITSGGTLGIQGGITVGAEALTIRGAGDAANGATGALENVSGTNNYGGLITLGAASTISSDAGLLNITNPGTITGPTFDLTLTGPGEGSIASIIGTTSGDLIKNGTGKWTLTGANTYTGTTTINAGILNIQYANALGADTSNDTTITAGATLQIEGGISTPLAEGLTLRGNGAAGTTGALQSVSGFNSWNGIVTLGANSTISVDAGVLLIASTGNLTGAFDLTLTGAGEGYLSDIIATGANTVTKTGTGIWRLTEANTFSAALTVANGTLIVPAVNDAGDPGPLGDSALAVTLGAAGGLTGTLRYNGWATETSNKPFILAAGGTGRMLSDAFPLSLTGVISGSGGLVIGNSDITLTGVNTFTGTLTITGELSVPTFNNASTNGPLGNSASAVVLGPPDSGSSVTLAYTGGTTTTNKPLFLAAQGFVDVTNAATELTLSASISGVANLGASLAKSGPGKLILPVANSYLGTTFVYDGTLVVAAAGAISGTAVSFQGGTLQLAGAPGINRITDTCDLNFQGGTLSMAGLSNASESVDLLRLSAHSGIDFGTGTGNSLLFSGISTHTAGTKLAITNWTGTPGVLGTASTDRLIFTGSASAFTAAYTQSDVSFNGVAGYMAIQDGGQYEIVAMPASSYPSWIAGFGITGPDSNFDADPDKDGVVNGLEWILGGSPLTSSVGLLPQITSDATNIFLTFTRSDASETSALSLEWGTDLSAWTNVPIGATSSGPNPQGISVTVTENGAAADTIVLTIPRANDPPGMRFVRLKATLP